MLYQYGYYKPLVAKKLGTVMTVRQMVPPSFVAVLGVALVLSAWVPAARVAFAGVLGLYVLGAAGVSVSSAVRIGARAGLLLPLVFLVMHFSYGVGFVRGTIDFVIRGRGLSGGEVRSTR
jgi:hypothetical protein